MQYEQRPWLAVVPWSQVMIAPPWYVWTVLPSWPPYQKRIICREVAPTPFVFTPGPMDMVTVLVPDERDALAALAATFGGPLEVIARWTPPATWWDCPQQTAATVDTHLRDWHGTLDLGSPSYRHSRDTTEALGYHWQLHQQQLVFPLPVGHVHT